MSEQAPSTAQNNSSETQNQVNEQHVADMHDFKLLDIAKVAVDAREKGIDSQVVEAKNAIKTHLDTLVAEGQITEAGAKNRADQLNRIIDGAEVGEPTTNEAPTVKFEALTADQKKAITDEVKKIRQNLPANATKEEINAAFTVFRNDLLRDGGINPEEANQLIVDACREHDAQRREQSQAKNQGAPSPEDVPSTEDLEENKGKLSWRRRALNVIKRPNAYIGLGLYKINDMRANSTKKAQRQPGESEEEFEKRKIRAGRIATVATVAIGLAVIGAKTRGFGFYDGDEPQAGGSAAAPETPAPEGTTDQGGAGEGSAEYTDVPTPENTAHTPFEFNRETDPFDETGKSGVHNYGDTLDANPGDIKGIAGTQELQDSWANSANQLSTAGAEMGLDGFSTDNLDGVASSLESNPEFASTSHAQLLEILNNPNTKISEGTLEPGTYGSYYQVDVNGDLVNAYDDTVNEPGTTIKVEWQDKNGAWHEVEFKKECGGQIIHRHPVAVEAGPTPTFAPITETQNLGQGGANPQQTQPQPETQPYTETHPQPEPETEPQPEPETEPEPEPEPEPETESPVTLPPATEPPLEEKHIDENDIGIWDAPLAEPGELAPPAQESTDPVVVEQAPGEAIVDQNQTGGMADGAESTTPQEEQQQEETDPAVGAVDGGTETNLFGATANAGDTQAAPTSTSTTGTTSATTNGGASAPAN